MLLLRNLALYLLMFHGYRHFKDELSVPFLTAVFFLALLFAAIMQFNRLKLFPAIVLAALFPFLIRATLFFIFGIMAKVDPAPESDFLFLNFDRDFYPSLIPWLIVWLFNFLALRFPSFIVAEVLLNSYLLLLIFMTETEYRVKLYHPALFIFFLGLFILIEAAVLLLLPLREKTGRRIWPGSIRSSIKTFSLLILVVLFLLVSLAVFLMNRYSEVAKKTGGGLMEPTLFRFDFSRYIKLESEIEMSDDLVMLFRKDGPATNALLRRFVLSEYDRQRGFYQTQNKRYESLPSAVADSPEELYDPEYLRRAEVQQEYFLVNFDPTSLVGMNYPVRIVPLKNWDSSSFVRIYRIYSKVSFASFDERQTRQFPQMPPDLYQFYTRYGDDRAIKDLAELVTASAQTYYEKILALESYLKDNFLYSLRPGLAEDGDQLKHFLFESRKGYCSYFAFAMTLMARSLGIPARVAVGFLVDPEKEVLNFYEIRAYQAHAWVEVFFDDLGWIEFDPTSDNLAPDQDIRFLFGFDFNRLSSLIEEILNHQEQLTEEIRVEPEFSSRLLKLGQNLFEGIGFLARYWYATLPCLYLLILLPLKTQLYLRFLLARSRRKKTKLLYSFSLILPFALGWGKASDESLLEYAQRLKEEHGVSLPAWTDHYLEAVFAYSYREPEYERGIRLYAEYIASCRAGVPVWIRFLAFFNPTGTLRKKG